MRRLICFCISIYQYLLAPFLGPCCRFEPSCSQYAKLAITQRGLLTGVWLTLRRLLRCHPWADGGYDPILPNNEKS